MNSRTLPEHWEVVRLEEATEIIMGQSPKGDTYNTDGEGEPLINGPAEFGLEYPTPVQWTSKPTKLCKDGDILFCVRGNTTGRMNIADQRYCIGRGIAAIRERIQKSDTSFIKSLLEYERPSLYRIAVGGGSTFPNISTVHLKNYTIPLPPLPEQRAITHVLGAIQEAKAARQRELALERERKATLMDRLFSYGTKGEPRKQTEIGGIPESWEVVELGNYSELITKGSSPKWQGFDYCDEGISFVRSQNIGLGRLELNEIAYLPKEFNKKEKKSILQKNDLLINIVGASIGRAAVANDIIEGGNVNQAVAIVRLKPASEPFFVMTFLLTLGGQFQLHKQKKDIARANLSLQDIKSLLIPLPSVSEQTETVEILRACDTKIAALEREAERLDELFRTMLDELMTGRRSAVPLIDSELSN